MITQSTVIQVFRWFGIISYRISHTLREINLCERRWNVISARVMKWVTCSAPMETSNHWLKINDFLRVWRSLVERTKTVKKQLRNQQQITMSHEIRTINYPWVWGYGAHSEITLLDDITEMTGYWFPAYRRSWRKLLKSFGLHVHVGYLCHINVRMSSFTSKQRVPLTIHSQLHIWWPFSTFSAKKYFLWNIWMFFEAFEYVIYQSENKCMLISQT